MKTKENLVSSPLRVSSEDHESLGKGLWERVCRNIESSLVSDTPLSSNSKVVNPSEEVLGFSSFFNSD